MSINGQPSGPPTKVGTVLGDLGAALFAVSGINAALYEREKSGIGQHIDVSLVDSVFSLLEHAVLRYTASGEVAERIGSRHPALCPFDVYKCSNGVIAIGTASNPVACRLAEAIGRPEWVNDPNYSSSNAIRVKNADYIESILEEWTSQRTKEEVAEIFEKHDVPCGPVYTIADAVKDPHFTEREMLVDVEHPVAGTLKLVGATIKLSRTPCEVKCAGPLMGQHNEEVFKGLLKLSDEEIDRLKHEKVI